MEHAPCVNSVISPKITLWLHKIWCYIMWYRFCTPHSFNKAYINYRLYRIIMLVLSNKNFAVSGWNSGQNCSVSSCAHISALCDTPGWPRSSLLLCLYLERACGCSGTQVESILAGKLIYLAVWCMKGVLSSQFYFQINLLKANPTSIEKFLELNFSQEVINI